MAWFRRAQQQSVVHSAEHLTPSQSVLDAAKDIYSESGSARALVVREWQGAPILEASWNEELGTLHIETTTISADIAPLDPTIGDQIYSQHKLEATIIYARDNSGTLVIETVSASWRLAAKVLSMHVLK